MVAYRRLNEHYRLEDLGFELPNGFRVLPPETFSPIGEATRLMDDARAMAAAIVGDAKIEYENQRLKGFREGLAQGRLQAMKEALRQNADLDARLQSLEYELSAIVMTAVRKLVDGFDADAQALAVVHGALKQMRRERKAELRVSPEQVEYFRSNAGAILGHFPGFELIEVIEDATLSPPCVVVETSIGRVEGDLGSRLEELAGIVQETVSGALSSPVENHDDDGDVTDGDEPDDPAILEEGGADELR